jgi:hypothetical protein
VLAFEQFRALLLGEIASSMRCGIFGMEELVIQSLTHLRELK